jgi:hypothetical protein
MNGADGGTLLKTIMFNWRGGLTGIAGFLLVWGVVFFIAFMTALGNNTPEARIILQGVSVFFYLANPVWGIPLAYCAGAVLVQKRPET